ncbi:MAG: hypothetical protein XD44_1128 [Methanobacteriaceae archaeon 41_258]|nr:MAG: hypothetical protein XD44_1128 [Methanobacteriaceae archaeon 41_258]
METSKMEFWGQPTCQGTLGAVRVVNLLKMVNEVGWHEVLAGVGSPHYLNGVPVSLMFLFIFSWASNL